MGDFRKERLGLKDAASLLGIRVSELKAAVLAGEPVRGVAPLKILYISGGGGLVFEAGDVLDLAEQLKAAAPVSD